MNLLNLSMRIAVCIAIIGSHFLSVAPAEAAGGLSPSARTIRVSTNGSDVSNCGTEAQPCRSIQFAVNQAASGDTILVAAGSYTYNAANDPCGFLVTRAVVCFHDKQLSILGGYRAGNWSTPNPSANVTVIDGQSAARGVAVHSSNQIASLNMKGFTIQNGRANGLTSGNPYDRHAFGAGMWAHFSFVNLEDIIFKNNITSGGTNLAVSSGGWAFGGGLAIEGPTNGGYSALTNVVFDGNQALGGSGQTVGGVSIGGGLFASQAELYGNLITLNNNLAKGGNSNGIGSGSDGHIADALGGGMGVQFHPQISFSYVTATGNRAVGGNAGTGSNAVAGSGLGGGVFVESANFAMIDSTIASNQAVGGSAANGGAAMGGGLLSETSNVTLDRDKFLKNTVTSGPTTAGGDAGPAGGGGAYLAYFNVVASYTANVTNSLFAENRAAMGSPGSTRKGGGGGGLFVQAMTANLSHTTFANNTLGNGLAAGVAVIASGTYGPTNKHAIVNMWYSIVSDHLNNNQSNSSAITTQVGSAANLHFTLLGRNINHTNESGKPFPPGTFTFDNVWRETASAGFVDSSPPDGNYHLTQNSVAVNRAATSTIPIDLDHRARPSGAGRDLGAYEFNGVSAAPSHFIYTPLVIK